MTLCYGPSGKLDYVYLSSASQSSDSVMVARTKPNGTTNPFSSLAGGRTDYQLYKNGVPATVADLRQYDVATYDSGANIIRSPITCVSPACMKTPINPPHPQADHCWDRSLPFFPGCGRSGCLPSRRSGDAPLYL